jgi:tripartite-type tricarboxylate transporter receptor subunit TctC
VKFAFSLVALAATCAAGVALAQAYPNRPIKVVVPWPPGQATDTAARVVTEKMSAGIGQQFVIDNRAGAGGTIGTEFAAKSAPDGYTILAGSSGPMSISPKVQKVGYDADRELEPICLMATSPYVLVVNPSLPASNLAEFIALVRASPGKYTFASSGTGATAHLISESFNSATKLDARHVPYKGSAPALTDLIAGHVNYSFETSAAVLGHVKAGRLKALAVSSASRALALPELPTVAEAANLSGFDMRAWIGLVAPTGLPREARAKLTTECHKVLQTAETKEKLLSLGLEPGTLPAEEFAGFLRVQSERFGAIAKQANIRLD